MRQLLPHFSKTDIGVLIVPPLFDFWACYDFIGVTRYGSNVPKRIKVICHEPRFAGEFDANYGRFTSQPYVFHLFALPGDIVPQQFRIEDIEYPVPIQGCVLSIDSESIRGSIRVFDEQHDRTGRPNFDEMMKQPKRGGAAWIGSYNLPFVVALENSVAGIPYDTLQRRCSIPMNTPMISAPEKFQETDVQSALLALLTILKDRPA